jgi:toxin-antitoxin system PIN domain toxin
MVLLDVNVLIALFSERHVHYRATHDWFAAAKDDGWATCPLTENGFVRVMRQRRPTWPVGEFVRLLRRFCSDRHHQFWPDTLSLTDTTVFEPAEINGPQQITDVYLLALAVKKSAALATIDRSIPLGAVRGASDANLLVISVAPGESTAGDS